RWRLRQRRDASRGVRGRRRHVRLWQLSGHRRALSRAGDRARSRQADRHPPPDPADGPRARDVPADLRPGLHQRRGTTCGGGGARADRRLRVLCPLRGRDAQGQVRMRDAMIHSRQALSVMAVVLVMLAGAAAEASHLTEHPRKHKIVYHLTDPGADKAKAVLGNIRNHVKGVGGWQHIEALELVVHGTALKSVLRRDMDPEVRRGREMLQTGGMTFGACGNTMKGLKVTLADLAEGARELPQGGVVRVMELQDQGYVYIRP